MSVPFSPNQFAGAHSPLPVKRIPINQVRFTQHPNTMNESKIERMKESRRDGWDPPIGRQTDDGTVYVLDGHHRTEAVRRSGKKTIQMRISS
jgi:ParB-like chromosome segregation protein Spo0J